MYGITAHQIPQTLRLKWNMVVSNVHLKFPLVVYSHKTPEVIWPVPFCFKNLCPLIFSIHYLLYFIIIIIIFYNNTNFEGKGRCQVWSKFASNSKESQNLVELRAAKELIHSWAIELGKQISRTQVECKLT